jgi:putative membrane protein
MKTRLLIAVSGSILALTACGKNDRAADNNAVTDTNVVMDNGMAADTAALSPLTAQGFVNAAAASDKFEIESSKLAATASQSAAVKSFATKMITAHEGSTAKLKSTLSGMNPAVTPDDTLNAEQQASLDSLKAKTGADFDTAYKAAQVDAHQKALDALNNYGASGDNDALKTFAKGLSPTVAAHLNMAKGLK